MISLSSDPSLKVRTGEEIINDCFCHVDAGNITSFLFLIAIVM